MKFNNWTVALAALGVVSLASAAKAEEKPSASVMTALSSTTISGYVDTSAQWNFGTGNANLPPYKFGGASKADGFNLDVVQLRIEKPLDEGEWSAGYRVDLWAGPDANVLGTQSFFAATGDFAIRQAYVALRMPVGNGIDWKIGVFDSIIGYESVESPNNPNYTRSFGHTIEPQTHTGVLASYRFSDLISMSAGVADTVGPVINERAQGPNFAGVNKAESAKTYMGSIALTAPDSLGFLQGSTLYGGVVSGFSDRPATDANIAAAVAAGAGATPATGANQTSYYAGATLATPVTGLRLGGAFDYRDVNGVHGTTWSLAGYASYQASEKLSLHLRGEYLRDTAMFFMAYDAVNALPYATNPNKVLSLTATAQYDLWKNVISRLELRWDHSLSGPDVYGGSAANNAAALSGDQDNAWMLAANIIYKF
jgi:Putative beta-barrel porin-2, OmpL-like. bbp2